jgi:hypothetical protein
VEDWLEKVDGLPDGHSAELLKRLPYDRARLVEAATERDQVITAAIGSKAGIKNLRGATYAGWLDAVLRAHLWSFTGKDYLTGETTNDIGKAAPPIISDLRVKAAALYLDWVNEALPGPKDTSETDSPTPNGEKAEPSETDAET